MLLWAAGFAALGSQVNAMTEEELRESRMASRQREIQWS